VQKVQVSVKFRFGWQPYLLVLYKCCTKN